MNDIKEIDILDKSEYALRKLFHEKINIKEKLNPTSQDIGIDGTLSINSTHFSFVILAKPSIGRIVSQWKILKKGKKDRKNLIFILDYATKELTNFLKKENLFFLDAIGNAYINLPELKLLVEGRTPAVKDVSIKRAFQKTGLKLIFELLRNPNLTFGTYREISSKTKISLASVSYIIDELKEQGFIVESANNKRHLSNIKNLINKWAISYAENLRPKIHRGYFRSLNESIFSDLFNNKDFGTELFLGGEYGAYIFNKSIKPERLTIYTNCRLGKLAREHQIIPISTLEKKGKPIEILELFWIEDNDKKNQEYRRVDPILIYADLLLSNNYRSVETAEALFQNEIRDRFLRHNLQW